jgi:RNA polymerase sigma-70 factor (ECF subfamily)
MDDQQERQVAQGLREGKVEAWRTLYEAFAEQVWRTVARLLGPDSADIPDVVQETFLAAAHSAATFDPERGSLGMWLWGIARRQVALHGRKQEQVERFQRAETWLARGNGRLCRFLEGQEKTLPEDDLAAEELATLVRTTLAELPQEYEMLLTGKYLDSLPVEDLARQTRSTSTAVRSKLARARQAFRQAFTKYERLS